MGDHGPALEAFFHRARRALSRDIKATIGILIVCLVVLASIFAPYIAPHDPTLQDLSQAHRPPAWEDGGSHEYLLGTDYIGRDILSRVIFGSRVSLLVAIGGVLIASTMGIVFGLTAGYMGGWIDSVIMRLVDVVLAVPYVLLVVFVVSLVGASLTNVILIFGITDFALFTRTVRGEVLALRESQFIEAAVAVGARSFRIIRLHLFPNILGSVLTIATFEMASMILWEAGLGFLGLSVPPIIPSWGNMMADGRNYIRSDWWLITFPGLAVMIFALGVNLSGDWLRFRLDPRSRGTE
jgi:ABC-type dipeptide/oligopeptide/nickel transport system permease subunit